MEETSKKSKPVIIVVILILAVVVIAGGISIWNNRQPTLIGGEKDEHGCLGAAGYSWCDARQACERSWEKYCTVTTPRVAVFSCENSKTISATFYPSDDKYVDLVLSDDKALSVPRAMSASGARYAKADESFVFWNKGDTAFVTENGTTTFSGCVTEVK
ncbi:MAG: MliC family protein [Candidatus Taylorbacteria bacterium]|nr:MliC family protein [Candidatus Taylorbacteria bacterium]